jgi:hypothetical protein
MLRSNVAYRVNICRFNGRYLLLNVVFLPEPFNASGCVYEFLFAGEERVAG